MQQFKSANVAILKRCQFGTFEPLHGISNLFCLNNFFLGAMKKSLDSGKVDTIEGGFTVADGISVRTPGEQTFEII